MTQNVSETEPVRSSASRKCNAFPSSSIPPQRQAFTAGPSWQNPVWTICRSAGRRIISSTNCSHSATDLGAPLLMAHFPRAFLDVNREPYELDPRMFDGPLPPHANISSMRVAGGLGTVPRLVAENMEIYRGRFPVAEALERIETIYKPYHACLRRLIARTHVQLRAGRADRLSFDARQYPRLAGTGQRPDFIIGDRYGTSASADLSRAAVCAAGRARLFRCAQQALCRRLHHRTLRPPGARAARAADRDQSRSLCR